MSAVPHAALQALEAGGARRLRNESFFSAPQLKRIPLATVLNRELRGPPASGVPQHRVEDREQFPGARDEGNLFRLPSSEQPLVEAPELRIPATATQRGQIEGGAHASSASPHAAF